MPRSGTARLLASRAQYSLIDKSQKCRCNRHIQRLERNTLMKLFSGRLLTGLLVLIATAFSLPATAATVVVSYYSLSPNPVSIKTGDVVYWVDGDDLGPYVITIGSLIFPTPDGVQFNAPGTYSYSEDSAYGGGPWSGSVVVTDDAPPTVSITSPTNNSVL